MVSVEAEFTVFINIFFCCLKIFTGIDYITTTVMGAFPSFPSSVVSFTFTFIPMFLLDIMAKKSYFILWRISTAGIKAKSMFLQQDKDCKIVKWRGKSLKNKTWYLNNLETGYLHPIQKRTHTLLSKYRVVKFNQ